MPRSVGTVAARESRVPQFLEELPRRTLDDLALDADAHTRYVTKFLTTGERNGGVRTIDGIERLLQRRAG